MLPSQLILIEDNHPYFAYIGGVGSGKTRGGALKGLKFCLQFAGCNGLVTNPSYKGLQAATIPTYETVFTKRFIKSFNKTDMEMTTWNDNKIWFRSTDLLRLEKALEGPTVGFAHLDEASKSPGKTLKIAQARVRQKGTPKQLWVTTTPSGFNWIYQEFIAKERANYGHLIVFTKDNYLLGGEYYERLKESYDDPQYALQQLEGAFLEIGGECPFDMKQINGMYLSARDREPVGVERNFIYTYTGKQIGKRYVIGADAATGQGEDESAFVLGMVSPVSIEVVCCGKEKMPEAEFAELLAEKGAMYNNALIVVESAPVGKATLQKLEEMRYPNILKHKDNLGFPSSRITKPLLVADLAEAVKSRILGIPHLDIMEQLMSYIRNEKGQYMATSGARDDYVSALMMLIQGVKEIPMVTKMQPIQVGGGVGAAPVGTYKMT